MLSDKPRSWEITSLLEYTLTVWRLAYWFGWRGGGGGEGREEEKEGNLRNALLYESSSLYGIRTAILLHEIAVLIS